MTVINMDCIEGMRLFPDAYFDSIVTDPPYELGFMGKTWDASGIANSVEMWSEALRVLKPGGHLLAFSGSRTYHRMVCAIEDAGFEIRDQIMWVYSSGFPKSHNLDNHHGGLICGCEPSTERDLHPVRDTDVSAPLAFSEGRGQVLQPGLSQSSAPTARRAQLPAAEDGRGQLGLEGWGDHAASTRELCSGSLRESTHLGAPDGAERWLHHGAPAGDGRMVRDAVDADGDGASHRPRPNEQSAQQLGAMAGQPESQAGGTWPVCGRCGKPVLPRGLGTALKPAHEPIVVARKPLIGTVAANVLAHGTGALNIDECRVEIIGPHGSDGMTRNKGYDRTGTGQLSSAIDSQKSFRNDAGRWPANLIHDGSDEVLAMFPDAPGQAAVVTGDEPTGHGFSGVVYGHGGKAKRALAVPRGDKGSAARFFYCAKASKSDRNEGLDDFPLKPGGMVSNTSGQHMTRRDGGAPGPTANNHPTVKPTALMRYLCRLVTPPGGTVLDPFTGSGSTGKAARLEGFEFVGFELDPDYVAIATARIENAA